MFCLDPRCVCLCSTFVFVLTLSQSTHLLADDNAKVLDLAAKSIAANHQNLKNIKCSYELRITDPASGEATIFTQSQAFTEKEFRIESYAGKKISYSLCYCDGAWHRSIPEANSYEIKPPESMPGLLPIDPREFGVFDSNKSLLATLQKGKILKAKLLKQEDATIAFITIEQHRHDKNVITLNYQLDSRINYLPVIVTQMQNDDITASIEIQYKSLPENSAWMPKSVIYKYYNEGIKELGNKSYHQIVEQRLTDVKTQQTFARDFFTETIPKGYTVKDQLKNIEYVKE